VETTGQVGSKLKAEEPYSCSSIQPPVAMTDQYYSPSLQYTPVNPHRTIQHAKL